MVEPKEYWLELAMTVPPGWEIPGELKAPTSTTVVNLVIQMLSSELLDADLLELAGLFLAEKSRFYRWHYRVSEGGIRVTGERQLALVPIASHVVGRVYEKWEAYSRKMERRGRVAHSADSEKDQLVATLRAGIVELARIRYEFGEREKVLDSFTDSARRVVERALDEARPFGKADPEHILLGIGAAGGGLAASVLDAMEVSLAGLRERIKVPSDQGAATDVEFSERAETVFATARAEGVRLIGTEHLLLGVIQENGAAAKFLAEQAVTLERARTQIRQSLAELVDPNEPVREMTPVEIALDERIAEVSAAKLAALKSGDYESAAQLRQQEKDLMHELGKLQNTNTKSQRR